MHARTPTVAHPFVWTVLYLPFGAMSGFVTVALTYLATTNGLSITEGSFFNGAQLLSQWLKWTWAPAVDVTLTPKKWYLIGTGTSAVGVMSMSAIPMNHATLPWLLVVVAIASLVNSIVGMAIESIMAQCTTPEEQGRTSAWFQAGNLGGAGLGGGLGLTLLSRLPEPWMAGAILGGLFMACGLALLWVPQVEPHRAPGGVKAAVVGVFGDIAAMARTKGGLLSAFLCFLPIGTGAAQGVLTQATVAARWGATVDHVAIVQGYSVGLLTAIGCFAGGWLCTRMHPRTAYAVIGMGLAGVAVGMAVVPVEWTAPLAAPLLPVASVLGVALGYGPVTTVAPGVVAYIGWNLVYAFGVGLAYAAFTAVVLNAIGTKSGATKYNLFASLSNFPIWWLGLALGRIADTQGAEAMLIAEAAFAVVAIVLFLGATRAVGRTQLPDVLEEA